MKYSNPNEPTPSLYKINTGGRTPNSTRVRKETRQSQVAMADACKKIKKTKYKGINNNVVVRASPTCNLANAREVSSWLKR